MLTFLDELIDLAKENEGSMFTLKVSDTTIGQKSSETFSNFENILSTSTPSFPRDLTTTKDNESSGKKLLSCLTRIWGQNLVIFLCFSERKSKEKSIFSVLQQMYIPVTRPAEPERETHTGANISRESKNISQKPSENDGHHRGDIETYEGSKLKKVLRESAAIKSSEPISDSEQQESDPDSSLLIPLLSLAIIILITLALGTFRLFYTKFYKDKEESLSR